MKKKMIKMSEQWKNLREKMKYTKEPNGNSRTEKYSMYMKSVQLLYRKKNAN